MRGSLELLVLPVHLLLPMLEARNTSHDPHMIVPLPQLEARQLSPDPHMTWLKLPGGLQISSGSRPGGDLARSASPETGLAAYYRENRRGSPHTNPWIHDLMR